MQEESDEYDGTETEDYWFFCGQWFARSEGDKQIVRELIPTDEHGRPLRGGLEGDYSFLINKKNQNYLCNNSDLISPWNILSTL